MSTVVEIPTPDVSYIHQLEPRPLWKDIALEYLGTLTFVYISLAGVNQVVLSGTIDQFHIALCFCLGLSSGIIVAGQSGGHLNPAVTLTIYATTTDFGVTRLIGYIVAQVCGGFTAGLSVLAVYCSWINNHDNPDFFIGSFGTLKNANNSLFPAIVDQLIGSALLMFTIVKTPPSWFKPITIGVVLGGLGLFQGSNGFAFNLARDFGPRVASAIVFGNDVFSAENYWFWVPMIVPFFGCALGWFIAYLLKRLE